MKNKSFLILLLVCILAITAIAVGTVALRSDSEDETTKLLDINDAYDKVAMETDEATTTESKLVSSMDITEQTTEEETETTTRKKEETARKEETSKVEESATEIYKPVDMGVSELNFSSNDLLVWPVDGNIIVDYNMENTVYFKTLNQYKCSPAIAIQSELNSEVKSAGRGQVKEVSTNEEIGNYVVVSLGDGYELTYGQLKDIQVKTGDVVEEKEIIGYINEPTKYYTKEGYNLYLKLTVDGKPEDPLDYLNY